MFSSVVDAATHESDSSRSVPSVVVVDPRFDAYKQLASSARLGRIDLHFRSSGADAVKLARRLKVDAWLIASDLDDMSGHDLVQLLKERHDHGAEHGAAKVAIVTEAGTSGRQRTLAELEAADSSADSLLSHPITLRDLERLLGLPIEERSKVFAETGAARAFITLPIGVGAAVVAIAVLMLG
jgi:CheY-like chemotaxis protein